MIVCPVCEHPQPHGGECEVCGKRLGHGPSAADLALPPVDGLEPTGHPPSDAGAERLLDLEPTRHAAVRHVPDATPELEATRMAPVDVEVEPVPDVEPTGASPVPGDGPTAVPSSPTCRYCRTAAAPGERVCGRCGMRLPVYAARAEGAGPVALHRCTCGAAVVHGTSLCPSCGARFAS
jgi:hypothetical protein